MPRHWDNSEYYKASLAAKNNIKKLQRELIKPKDVSVKTYNKKDKNTQTNKKYTKVRELNTTQAFGPKY